MPFVDRINYLQYESNDALPLFKIDRALVEQILHNIVHNAIQYTPAGSTVQIAVAKTEEGCEIEITDNGKGFPEDKINAVFDKFYRLPNTATGGTGLGLSIAKGFAQAHGGSISVVNNPSGGAKFTVKIPSEISYLNTYENE
ncbi:ATP-binding protein [Salegentibacter sp. F188]|uniref:histidine kinase n=1 Tax=Autumnicola patrickiae TaxID=3075591 RepID=A0ABU3DZT7_9FLAO|nr:ATP-binding protein [Salegentibacter sp. F188]MDT0689236.1 ATP-binding protein [Salegentibacter sp. F188]